MAFVVSWLRAVYNWWDRFVSWVSAQAIEGFMLFSQVIAGIKSWVVDSFASFFGVVKGVTSDLEDFFYWWGLGWRNVLLGNVLGAKTYLSLALSTFKWAITDWVKSGLNFVQTVVQNITQNIYKTVHEHHTHITQVVGVTKDWVLQQIAALNVPRWVDIQAAINQAVVGVKDFVKPLQSAWNSFVKDPWSVIGKPVAYWFMGLVEDFNRGFKRGLEEKE